MSLSLHRNNKKNKRKSNRLLRNDKFQRNIVKHGGVGETTVFPWLTAPLQKYYFGEGMVNATELQQAALTKIGQIFKAQYESLKSGFRMKSSNFINKRENKRTRKST